MQVLKIFDQQQASGAPTLQDCPKRNKFFHCRYFDFEITVTGADAGAAVPTASVVTWLKASRLDAWYRIGDQRTAFKWIENVSLLSLSAEGCLLRDGSLVTADVDCPTLVAVSGAGAPDTFKFHIRVYHAWPTAKRADDLMVSQADIGDLQFTFGAFVPAGSTFIATNVQVVGYACGSYKRAYTCVPRHKITEQGSRTPQLTEEISLGGARLAALTFLSTNAGGTSPVTTNTQPDVEVDQVTVVDGKRMANLSSIARAHGEIYYPQGYSVGQIAYTPVGFCPIQLPDPEAQVSELPRGDQIQITYNASTATAGQQFLCLHAIVELSDAEVAARTGSVGEVSRQSGSDKPVPASVENWLPAR